MRPLRVAAQASKIRIAAFYQARAALMKVEAGTSLIESILLILPVKRHKENARRQCFADPFSARLTLNNISIRSRFMYGGIF